MIRYILFDLDNTLYSAHYGLEDNVSRRIIEFLAMHFDFSLEEAERQHRDLLKVYSTTAEWLITEKGFTDIEPYYAAIHPVGEADSLPRNPQLRSFLASLHLPLAVLTNSPKEHADRILDKLAISDLFTRVFDIRWNRFRGKPAPETFHRVLDVLGTAPETTLFIDDIPRCVEGYLALGGKGLLLDEPDAYPSYTHDRIRTLPELTGFIC